jgi:ubiquitin-conjugating enzyme E2 O
VRWSRREDVRTEYTENLRLVDRVFLLGDIVASAADQIGQTGVVVGMRMFCDVRRSDGTILRRVPTPVLQPLAVCRPGALIVHTVCHWLGRIDEVYDNVHLAFDDGSACKVMRTGANTLNVHSPTMDEQTWFWPGMRVSATREVLRRAKWTKGSYRSGYVGQEATVTRVQAAQALVRWLAAAPVDGHDRLEHASIQPPPDIQRPSHLLELQHHHARTCWRLGEHATIAPDEVERLLLKAATAAGAEEDNQQNGSTGAAPAGAAAATGSGGGKKQRKEKKRVQAIESCVEVLACHTRVDVLWQDGTRDTDGEATVYAPAKHVDGYYEFWPQDLVVGKSPTAAPADRRGEMPPVGVVESVNHEQRICVVTWRGAEAGADGTPGHAAKREVVPVYELSPHPDFSFKVGDVVLRLGREAASTLHSAAAEGNGPTAAGASGGAGADASGAGPADDVDDVDNYDDDGAGGAVGAGDDEVGAGGADLELARSSLRYIGEVVTVGTLLTVRWMDGTLGTVKPEEAYLVNTEEEDEQPPEEDEGSHDDEGDPAYAYDDDEASEAIEADRVPVARRARARGSDDEGDGDSSGWETVDDDADEEDVVDDETGEEDEGGVPAAAAATARSAPAAGDRAEPMQVTAAAPSDAEDASSGRSNPRDAEPAAEGAAAEGTGAEAAPGPISTVISTAHTQGLYYSEADEEGEESFASAEDEEEPEQDAQAAEAEDARERAARAAVQAMVTAEAAAARSAEERAAIAAYAEHDHFWVDESEAPWSWHHYYHPPGASASSSSSAAAAPPPPLVLPPKFAKTAQKQWRLLQAGLPEGIYVVACSGRVDLMSVLITGPPGTPYQDAVFIFDVQLPPEFPQQPPLVHYLSHGQRINPNLYENGKVCLSLLGTWTGHQSCELWNPDTSTVLQILLSIQALVLCEMPYFNEAGYDKQLGTVEGAHHARRYNEGALLLTIKAMTTTLQHLSPPFERLTRLHFRTVRRRVLERLHTLLKLKPPDEEPPQPQLQLQPPLPPPPPPQPQPSAAGTSGAVASRTPGTSEAPAVATPATAPESTPATAPTHASEGSAAAAPIRTGRGTGAGGAGGKEALPAATTGPVAEAQLCGILNDMPSLGFLHSLARQMAALTTAFDEIELDDECTPAASAAAACSSSTSDAGAPAQTEAL